MTFDRQKLIETIGPVLKKYNVNTVYLFGSRANGTHYSNSDIDLGLLLGDFGRTKTKLIIDIQMEIEGLLHPTPVVVIILQNAPLEMRFQIIKTGAIIYCRNDDFRTDFEDVVMRDYLDFKPFLDMYQREVKEALREGHFFVKP